MEINIKSGFCSSREINMKPSSPAVACVLWHFDLYVAGDEKLIGESAPKGESRIPFRWR